MHSTARLIQTSVKKRQVRAEDVTIGDRNMIEARHVQAPFPFVTSDEPVLEEH